MSADVAGAVAAAAAAQQQLAGAMAKPATLNDAAKAAHKFKVEMEEGSWREVGKSGKTHKGKH